MKYEISRDDGSRELIITGINLPRNKDFDPLAKIWASVRKRCKEEYGVDVIAVFFANEDSILCKFYLNYCDIQVSQKTYRSKFRRNFPKIVAKFANVLTLFAANIHNGYSEYAELWQNNEGISKYNECLNSFLKSAGLRTADDEKNSTEKAEKLKKAIPGAKKRLSA